MPVVIDGLRIIKLDTFQASTARDDISLIGLTSPAPLSPNIQPIQIEDAKFTDLNKKVMQVSGFGFTTTTSTPEILQWTELIGITIRECQEIYGAPFLTDKIQCTRGHSTLNSGSCYADR